MKKHSILTLLAYLPLAMILFITIRFGIAAEQLSGEIININYEYQIAFTDLSNTHLYNNDIVEITHNGEHITYLEVLESSEVITKLVPYKKKREFFTGKDFDKINIGNKVFKVSSADSNFESSYVDSIDKEDTVQSDKKIIADQASLNSQFKTLTENYINVSNQLAQLVTEKNRLEENYKELERKLLASKNENVQTRNSLNTITLENQRFKETNKDCGKKEQDEVIAKYKHALKELENKFIKIENLIEGK